jgi:hypothetical protein
MASKRRIRRKQCTGKIRYATKAEATLAAKRQWQYKAYYCAYHCLFCNGYHIGRPPHKKKRS